VDLNMVIPIGSPLYLTAPENINDRGEIAGVGLDSSGNQHVFLLIPCSPDECDCTDASKYPVSAPRPNITTPSNHRAPARRTFHSGLPTANEISSRNMSVAGSAELAERTSAVDESANKTGDALPEFPEPLDAGLSRSEIAQKCGYLGMPCDLPKRYDTCCPGLKCVFHGGSTRAGYACEK
jgi:hypothetical protein